MPKISPERLRARRRGIVRAAARCLQRNGVDGTGMRDLFRAANLSPGAVYRYFPSKDELLAAVADATPSLVAAALAATEGAEEPRFRLRRLLQVVAAGIPAARLQIELETAALRSPAIAAALAARRTAGRQALTAALQGADDAPVEELADLVEALCDGLARRRLLEPDADLSALATAAWRLLSAAAADRRQIVTPKALRRASMTRKSRPR